MAISRRVRGATVGLDAQGQREGPLAADAPDAALASTIAAAAHAASGRGAWQTAAELGEHSLRLTPRHDPERPKRAGWWSKAKAALGGS